MFESIMINEFKESIKNKTYICLDAGSCHMGKLDYAMRMAEVTKESGANCLKFQLGVCPPNIDLPFKDFVKVFEYGKQIGIDVTSSIFDEVILGDYLDLDPKFIKFAYSQKELLLSQEFSYCQDVQLVVSCDIMTLHCPIENAIRLFCIPCYPVYHEINFDSIFTNSKFYGFSDHSLGIRQTIKAVRAGAKWIEKHFTLGYSDIKCPDNYFALTPPEISKMVAAIRQEDQSSIRSSF